MAVCIYKADTIRQVFVCQIFPDPIRQIFPPSKFCTVQYIIKDIAKNNLVGAMSCSDWKYRGVRNSEFSLT